MLNLLGTLLGFTIGLAAVWAGICWLTGDEDSGNTILLNCITTMILCVLVLSMFSFGSSNGIFQSSIPMLAGIEKHGSVTRFFREEPAEFSLNFVEFTTLSLVVSFVSNLLKMSQSGIFSKIFSRIIVILCGIIGYGFFMDMVSGNIIMTYFVYAVEILITGGSLAYTPIMLIASITGLKTNNFIPAYVLKILKASSLGHAISGAISTSISFLAFTMIMETQYGSIQNMLKNSVAIFELAGPLAIMLMGISVMMKPFKRK